MSTTIKVPAEIYTESTPNPVTMKFVTNQLLLPHKVVEFVAGDDLSNSPLAQQLFEFKGISGVFITNNFITLTKNIPEDWNEFIPELKAFLKTYIDEEQPLFTDAFLQSLEKPADEEDNEVIAKIKAMLDNHVRPAVEMDGGNIAFKSFEDGKLTLILQGSCSGCPSASITLKSGIEGVMKRMIPQVQEVVAEEE